MNRKLLTVVLVVLLALAGCTSIGSPDSIVGSGGSAETAGSAESTGSAAVPDGATAINATVTRVIDGDTVEVELANGTTDTIRLLGVDTPETTLSKTDPTQYGYEDTTDTRDFAFNIGEDAKQFAEQRLANQEVQVIMDPESDSRGYYDRRLAYIYVDGTDFNRQLLAKGLARMYDSEMSKRSEYESVESTARNQGVGIWGYGHDSGSQNGSANPTPTPTPANESDDAIESGSDGSLETPTPSGGDDDPYDCSDFDSQEQAQQWFENHDPDADPAGLDSDGNGQACESI